MSAICDYEQMMEQVKARFSIGPEENDDEGWVIDDEVLFMLPLGDQSGCTFMLSAPISEEIMQQDKAATLTRIAAIQRDFLLPLNASIAIAEDNDFSVLQQVVYPNSPEEACTAVENFLNLVKIVSKKLISLVPEEEETELC